MDAFFLGQIMQWPAAAVPENWVICDGRSMPIEGNETLFSVLGTIYGGDGRSFFYLPDLRKRVAIGMTHKSEPTRRDWEQEGYDPEVYLVGDTGGQEKVTMTMDQMPSHSHPLPCSAETGTTSSPHNAYAAMEPGAAGFISNFSNEVMGELSSTGEGEAFDNMQPYLVMNFIICIKGKGFPCRA